MIVVRQAGLTVSLVVTLALMATSASAAQLIAHFPMEEHAGPLVDKVSGLKAEEFGNGHVYLLEGPTGFGNAVALTDDGAWNLSVADSAGFRDLANDFTVAAWVYLDGLPKPGDRLPWDPVLADNQTWDADGFSWGVWNVTGGPSLTKNGVKTFAADEFIAEEEWTHIAVTVSSTDGMTFYTNGEEVGFDPDITDVDTSTGRNGEDDFWGIGRANKDSGFQWFGGRLDEVRVYSDLLTPEEIAALLIPGGGPLLQAGDADQDLDFDQLDLVKVQIAAKYLSVQSATWGEGDWDGAPGGEPGSPPAGDGFFNQLDIITALAAARYLTGPYATLTANGIPNDVQTSLVYHVGTGELRVDAPAGKELTSINISSDGSKFFGDKPAALDGAFDNFDAGNVFKATFGGSFGNISFGNVLPAGLNEADITADLSAVGSLASGGDLGPVDLVYIPEPATMLLMLLGLMWLFANGGWKPDQTTAAATSFQPPASTVHRA